MRDQEPLTALICPSAAGAGVVVEPAGGEPFVHRVLLSGVAADTPMRRLLTNWAAINAYRGCGWCWLQSKRSADGVQWWAGYAAPAPAGEYVPNQPPPQLLHAGASYLTEQQLRERAATVGAHATVVGRKAAAQRLGCHGPSTLLEGVGYGGYKLMLLPIAHATLLGLVKDFLGMLFAPGERNEVLPWYCVPYPQRRAIAARAHAITVTDDFQRPYADVVNARGHWVMEDYLHFTGAPGGGCGLGVMGGGGLTNWTLSVRRLVQQQD